MPASIVQQISRQPGQSQWGLPLWVNLIGQGLLAYGYQTEVMELVCRTMDAVRGSLKRVTFFREYYDADTGQAIGERNHLRGLAPLGLFLKLIGIEKMTPKGILIKFNSFPAKVTVKYRSTILSVRAAETVITFSNGQTARVSGPGTSNCYRLNGTLVRTWVVNLFSNQENKAGSEKGDLSVN